jgi:hypothetical protein
VPKFRKKPIVIEAREFTGPEVARELADWCGGSTYQRYFFGRPQTMVIEIPTLEGTMEATEGDWLIKGVEGEFYPCHPQIFAKTYEPADV